MAKSPPKRHKPLHSWVYFLYSHGLLTPGNAQSKLETEVASLNTYRIGAVWYQTSSSSPLKSDLRFPLFGSISWF